MRKPVTTDERTAVYVMAKEGLTYKDIAKIMNRPIGTIHTIISKGILDGELDRRIERDNKRKD